MESLTSNNGINTNSIISNIRNQNKKIKKLFLGLLLYEVFNIFMALYGNNALRGPQLIGLVLLVSATINLLHFKIQNAYLNVVFKLYIVWNSIIILRFNSLSSDELRLALFQPIHLIAYFVPLVILINYNIYIIKNIFKFSITLCIVLLSIYSLVSMVLFPQSNTADLIITEFIPGASLLILSWTYQNKQIKYLSLISILFALISGMLAGRRNIIITSTMYLFLWWSFVVFIQRNTMYKKVLMIISSLILIFILYNTIDLNNNKNFETLTSRIDTDSRSEVILAFYKDFNAIEWIVGRGVDGTYYCPINYWDFSNDNNREVANRDTIENGFLFLILKGGAISLILFLSIAFPALYLGLFKSSNIVSKVFALFIAVYIVDMFSFGQPALSVKYVLVWISIAICYSREIRLLPEPIVANYLKS